MKMLNKIRHLSKQLTRLHCHRQAASLATLSYTEYGKPSKNPPIFIFHGLFGSKRNWTSISKKLIENNDRHVFAVDLRNHGNSEHTFKMSYDLMAEDCIALIESFKLSKPPVLIGHSMGGKVAMTIALKYSIPLSSLIIADVSPLKNETRGSVELRRLIEIMKGIDLSKSNAVNVSEFRTKVMDYIKPRISDEMLRAFILSNLREKSDKSSYEFSFNLNAIDNNLDALYSSQDFDAKYEGSTLFIAGSNSDYVTEKHVPTINKLFPANEIYHIKDAGHWLHYDKPKEFLLKITEFLSRSN
ncbi:DgyrCDS9887 [Dimorphilus gyrociliatus]|uniref:sn-1-specific diacylglycerol lipase ABHD11 n=1 Tax=Dimorphilus gyrociliatus TaxID=2664684 RepID=A0A7I8VZR4_9ANNE|nr:DgyrCDS9887 [Dimorphilus gyrociliatus]